MLVDKIEWPSGLSPCIIMKVESCEFPLTALSSSDILWNFSLFHLWRVKDDCCIFQLFPCPICQGWVMMIVAALFRLQVCNYYLFYFCKVSNWNVHQTTVCKLVYFGLKIFIYHLSFQTIFLISIYLHQINIQGWSM